MTTRTVFPFLCMSLCVGGFVVCASAAQPVVNYSFDTLSNVVADELGSKNDGTIHGDVTLTDGGYLGACFAFNGTDSYVELTRVIQNSFTLTAWIKTETPGLTGTQAYQGSGIFWSDVGGVANDFVVAALGTKLSFFAGNPDTSVNSKGDIVTGEWVHIAAVRDVAARTLSVYIDGKPDSTVAHSNTAALDAQTLLVIGANTLDSRYYTGLIDEVKIYDVALTAAEIRTMAPPKLKARAPDPANGEIGVSMPLLQWAAGDTGALHDVYLGADPNLTEANRVSARQTALLYYHVPGLAPGATYYWRVDEIEQDGVTTHTGDVWSFMAQDVAAYYPSPADKDNAASLTPTLTWMPGAGAIQHHVYFGADAGAVGQGAADTDKGLQAGDDTAFGCPALESLTTYFWRVDELGLGGTVRTGAVWSFTTALPFDDFESYTDDEGARIFDAWIDGYTDRSSGSTVGNINAPFAELTIVHDGNQSMPLDYNNIDEPFYSEATRELSPAQDWTAGGVDTLVLYVRGRALNNVAPLYVTLGDSAGKSASVVHPDAAIVSATKWIEWKIPLAGFAGVNPARIRTMILGVGDRANPRKDGKGRIYIDDIRLAKPAAP